MLKIDVKGFDAVIKKFDTLSSKSQSQVQSALNNWADKTAKDAKIMAPSNESLLRNSISAEYSTGSASVVASAKYAAYVEFGTRKFAASYVSSLPADWAAYANTFKGPSSSGGTFKELVKSIMEWCRKKGIDEKAAYPIARKIVIDGIRPHPYLYPSVNNNLPQLMKDIKDIFK